MGMQSNICYMYVMNMGLLVMIIRIIYVISVHSVSYDNLLLYLTRIPKFCLLRIGIVMFEICLFTNIFC